MKNINSGITFKIGKCYRHSSGEEIYILSKVKTTLYGECLVAESNKSCNLKPIGLDKTSAENWHEITYSEWMKNFS